MKKLILGLAISLLPIFVMAQYVLHGTVSDTQGELLPGANVILKNTTKGTICDADGFFIFTRLPEGEYTIVVSFIGYQNFEESFVLNAKKNLEIELNSADLAIKSIEVLSTWADEKTPITFSNLDKETLEKNNLGQDVPFLLKWTPSVVVTSDAGTGIGYTGIRMRGSDPTRINVTINGIPLNDAESQNVFWVDLPDFVSSTESIQIQRGVGTSTNGTGAFGGTINLNTGKVHEKPYAQIGASYGSFNTQKYNVQIGSGLLANKFTIDARVSKITTDGFIERAKSDLFSWFTSAAYIGDNKSFRLNVFSGHEVTYQAWNGVPAQFINNDSLRNHNTAGREKIGEPHNNEVDDYTQTHFQAIYKEQVNEYFSFDLAAHFTKGKGFFEQYKAEQYLGEYGFFLVFGDTTFNVIRQRWLENEYGGITYGLHFDKNKWKTTLGGAYSNYTGKHFGKVIWTDAPVDLSKAQNYYDNDAKKIDFNIFLKTNYELTQSLSAYVDLQYRHVYYEFVGLNNNGESLAQKKRLNFFNPKFGLFYQLKERSSLYASLGVANREPNRDDYTESNPDSRPRSERLINTELGYRQEGQKLSFGTNIYHMAYKDQLVLTGKINDVGEYSRTNVDNSYRLGLEIDAMYKPIQLLDIGIAATLSQNKITKYSEFVDNWDYTGNNSEPLQFETELSNTDISFSPNLIVSGELTIHPFVNKVFAKNHTLDFSLLAKYVGKQFIDNTSNDARKLDAYTFADFRIAYKLKTKKIKELGLTFLVRNIFDAKYSSNAWTYRFRSAAYNPVPDDVSAQSEGNNFYNLTGYYPQAGINFLLGLSLKF